ncbi:MAG: cold shock domain-containing protein [Bacteroidales bacterium]|nr:cold shock domain-containing protein [Bacteroidales bacterium]
MAQSQNAFNKREREKQKEKKRKEKEEKKLARKESGKKSGLDDMLAYVDKNGVISSTPPVEDKEEMAIEHIEISTPRQSDLVKDDGKTGTVIFFDEKKGFGFIKDDRTKFEIFVHINNVQGKIKEKDQVIYETEENQKGKSAINVRLVSTKIPQKD